MKYFMEVKAWIEQINIPTYGTGKPEKNPMFLEKRVYQGSSGVVYPHPVIEKIEDEKKDKQYTAVFLENEYLKIMILPELGGRIQRAYDKVRQRDFVYYNQVIKPALVGLAGPWISGGIEFNWPQHHRPSTFSPVDHKIEENADGSKTVWVNEYEVMFRTKGLAGFTLYPGKAYLEISGKLFNPTPFPQTFLWWANPAVKVNDHYQSVFPPDVYAVFDHGKRDVSDFPIATGTYYKVDYAPGTDISRYKNIPVPTSYMAIQSKYDFMGCYEHDTQAGMLHVADHHVSPGKKQWTWGNGDFGFAWDRNLTDEDGPYIELMTGVFTDNQPDFSWLLPNESKTFEQYFMPYAQVGVVKNATKEAMLSAEWEANKLTVKVYATAVYKNATISILHDGKATNTFKADLSPENIFEESFESAILPDDTNWQIKVTDEDGLTLVSYQPEKNENKEIPAAASAAKSPQEIKQVEDLFLNGLHLEQYRHATYNPLDYYEEALRRSPGDIRCNNAIGLLLLRRGQFAKAEPYFRMAISSLTKRNPNPYDGEPYFNLGLSLKLQGKTEAAFDCFYKATWNDAMQHSAFFELARIATGQSKIKEALSLVDKSLIRNYHNPVVRHLKAALLRIAGNDAEVLQLIKESLKIDAFNFGCLFEQYLLSLNKNDESASKQLLDDLLKLMREDANNYLELSLNYAHAGLFNEAVQVLDCYSTHYKPENPLVDYYKGWFLFKLSDIEAARSACKQAATKKPDMCFPNKIEEVLILQNALSLNPDDAKAAYYLGNFWYDKRQYADAILCWEQSAAIDDSFPTVHRNLSLAYFNKLQQPERSLAAMEKAFSLDDSDARVLMELDQLYKVMGRSFTMRLELLNKYTALVNDRDDLYLEKIALYNDLQEFETARTLLASRKFHPWEGGEGKVLGQFLLCHIELAKKAIKNGQFQQAIDLLTALDKYPENLGEGKLYNTPENDINYLLGCAYQGLHMNQDAKQKFTEATKGSGEPVQAIYYNDPQPDKILYKALAYFKLGEPEKAKAIFRRFIELGGQLMDVPVKIDYFAVSLPDMLVFEVDLDKRNKIFCKYLIGLGYFGLGDIEQGTKYLSEVVEMDPNHQGAALHLRMTDFFDYTNKAYAR
jgi:tetratricopeptide (TPR) repeat protein